MSAFALLLSASVAHAQDTAGAEAAAQSYAEAMAEQDWSTVAALTDPADLERFADFVGTFAAFAGGELGGTEALTEAETPEDAFATFMGLVTTLEPMMGGMLSSIESDILGSVTEADTLVHVVARTRFNMLGSEVRNLEVTTARWDGTRWVVKLNEQMEGMITAMETAFANPALLNDRPPPPPPPEVVDPNRDPKKRQ